jgi:hypothetical protein
MSDNQNSKPTDTIKRFHKSADGAGEGKVILVLDDRMDDATVAELDKLPGGSMTAMVNEGAEIALLLASTAPVATLDSVLLTLIQLRPAGRLYGARSNQGGSGDEMVTKEGAE